MKVYFKDGCGKPVLGVMSDIKNALLGDSSYVATEDERVVIVCDEEADDVSISINDDHYASDSLQNLNSMISEFLRLSLNLPHVR